MLLVEVEAITITMCTITTLDTLHITAQSTKLITPEEMEDATQILNAEEADIAAPMDTAMAIVDVERK